MLSANELGVAVHNGVVTLSGNVTSYLKKLTAEKAALRVKNVKAVVLDIEVRLGSESRRNDTEIATAAVSALQWNSAVPNQKIQVKVENGWVTLEGTTDWHYERTAAENSVHHLTGVTGITNLIRIIPPVNSTVVRENIRKALERNADVEAARIDVMTSGSEVILTGKVGSWAERKIAEQAAWSSPGVASVEDALLIHS